MCIAAMKGERGEGTFTSHCATRNLRSLRRRRVSHETFFFIYIFVYFLLPYLHWLIDSIEVENVENIKIRKEENVKLLSGFWIISCTSPLITVILGISYFPMWVCTARWHFEHPKWESFFNGSLLSRGLLKIRKSI